MNSVFMAFFISISSMIVIVMKTFKIKALKALTALSAIGIAVALSACGEKLEVKQSSGTPTAAASTAPSSAAAVTTGETVTSTATQLFNDYKTNEAATNDKFKGKTASISGVVTSVDKLTDGPTIVHLATGDELTEAHFLLLDSAKAAASALQSGAQVTLSCPKISREFDAPKGEDCTLLN